MRFYRLAYAVLFSPAGLEFAMLSYTVSAPVACLMIELGYHPDQLECPTRCVRQFWRHIAKHFAVDYRKSWTSTRIRAEVTSEFDAGACVDDVADEPVAADPVIAVREVLTPAERGALWDEAIDTPCDLFLLTDHYAWL
jgi:uncharacterized protein